MRGNRHTVRLGDSEEELAQKTMKALDCETVPEMFRLLLSTHETMKTERNRFLSVIEGIKNALRTFNR